MSRQSNKEIYYISSFYWKNYNAASKAKMDIERIFQSESFKPINLFKDGKNTRIFSLSKFFQFIIYSFFGGKYKNSTVFFQNGTGIDAILSPFIKLAFRNGKRVIFVHDIETIRIGRKIDFLREKIVFSKFTHAICPSEEMAEFLKKKFGFRGKTFVLGFFDYLIFEEFDSIIKTHREEFPENKKFLVVYAGNLSKWKAGFIHKIAESNYFPKNYKLLLYGKGYDGVMNEFLEIKGAYPPDELPARIQGHFGLIWDGDDIDRILGKRGEYLKYNLPHKTSLYIVSKLPIIAWKGSAIFKLIEEYNIGFGVDSLLELESKLENITPEQYEIWRSNIEKLRNEIINGNRMRSVIKSVINE